MMDNMFNPGRPSPMMGFAPSFGGMSGIGDALNQHSQPVPQPQQAQGFGGGFGGFDPTKQGGYGQPDMGGGFGQWGQRQQMRPDGQFGGGFGGGMDGFGGGFGSPPIAQQMANQQFGNMR